MRDADEQAVACGDRIRRRRRRLRVEPRRRRLERDGGLMDRRQIECGAGGVRQIADGVHVRPRDGRNFQRHDRGDCDRVDLGDAILRVEPERRQIELVVGVVGRVPVLDAAGVLHIRMAAAGPRHAHREFRHPNPLK